MKSSNSDMPALGNATTHPLQSLTQPEMGPLSTGDRSESSSNEDSTVNTPTADLSEDDIAALKIKRLNLLREVAQIESSIELARLAPSTTSSTQTDKHADIPVIASLNKCVSPLSLTILALVTSAIYFALQYELSAKANNLALRESCRSHPNDTYLQSLAICQDATHKGDVDVYRRSLASSTVLINSLTTSPLDQLSIDTRERIKQLLVLGKSQYRHVYNWMIHFNAGLYPGEFIVNCISYLFLATIIWKFTGKIWYLILRCLQTTLWLLLSIFFEIRIEPSPRGRHLWFKWRSPKALLKSLLQFIKNDVRSAIFGRARHGILG